MQDYSIRLYKEYFNFSSAHFLVFEDGSREPLHGHNYRVRLSISAQTLQKDMVIDFCHVKPVVKEICDSLDHLFLLPTKNPHIEIKETTSNIEFTTSDKSYYSFPKKDVLLLPIENISSERLAIYLASRLETEIDKRFKLQFKALIVEVEETPGQSACYEIKR